MFKFLFTHSLVISLLGCISIVQAETYPMLSDITVHKENNSYIYTAAGDWKSLSFKRNDAPTHFFRAKFDSDKPFYPTEGGKLAFCAYHFKDGYTLTLKLPEEKRKAILFYLKNWKPINHGTVYSCGGEGLTVEDCPFKKMAIKYFGNKQEKHLNDVINHYITQAK